MSAGEWMPVKEFPVTEAVVVGSVVTDNGAGSILNADAITERTLGIVIEGQATVGENASVQLAGLFEFARVDGTGTPIVVGDRLSPSAVDGIMIVHNELVGTVYAAKALAGATTVTTIPVLIAEGRADNA